MPGFSPYRIAFPFLFMQFFTNAFGARDDVVPTVLLTCPLLRLVHVKVMVNQAVMLLYLHQSLENAVTIVG
jgi:hypothetical protein